MKLEIFVSPTTSVVDIVSSFPKQGKDNVVKSDEKNGVITFAIAENALSDHQIEWIDKQKEHGRIEKIETE